MPNCFQLIDKATKEAASFQKIDEALCKHFNETVHPKFWYHGWYDYVGFALACGDTWEKLKADIRKALPDPEYWGRMLEIVEWLEARYDCRSWYESSSRFQ